MLLAVACSKPSLEVGRAGRCGSLRDLVLVERPETSAAMQLFVDRFEVTRADWAEFSMTARARERDFVAVVPFDGDPTLPVASLDLRQARAFAAWRFLRLPRLEEWTLAAVGDGRSIFPWGNSEDWTRANTGELGLGRTTPVGTFESGRRGGGNQPYDLVGNVSEWTESIPTWWWDGHQVVDGVRGSAFDPVASAAVCRRAALASPALAIWQGPGGLLPLDWAAEAGNGLVPRVVVGSDFQSPMGELHVAIPSGERRARTGLRLCATATELVLALLAEPSDATDADLVHLHRFVCRARHREVLVAAWSELALSARLTIRGTLGRSLQSELGFSDLQAGR